MNGHAILKPQRAELGDVDVQAEARVVIKISSKRIGLRANVADIVKQREAHARTVVLLKNGQAVFHRAHPVTVAANRLIRYASGIAGGIIWVTRCDVAIFDPAQRVEAAEIITVVKRYVAGTQTVRDAGTSDRLDYMAFEQAGEIPGGFDFNFVIHGVADAEFRVNFRPLAVIRQLHAVACVISQHHADSLKDLIAGLIEDGIGYIGRWRVWTMPPAIQADAHVFHGVADR